MWVNEWIHKVVGQGDRVNCIHFVNPDHLTQPLLYMLQSCLSFERVLLVSPLRWALCLLINKSYTLKTSGLCLCFFFVKDAYQHILFLHLLSGAEQGALTSVLFQGLLLVLYIDRINVSYLQYMPILQHSLRGAFGNSI